MTGNRAAAPGAPPVVSVPLVFTQSDSFVALLHELRASLWVTTYQAQQVLVVRAAGNGVSMLVRTFDKPMGLAVDARRVALGTRDRVWLLRNAPDIARQLEPPGQHDACYLPRSCHVTGDIAGHEMAWAGEELWVVNTRFSCLCTLHPDYSFVPRWQPRFLTALAADDRCHLNGLALAASDERGLLSPRYVTALAETDTPAGWRPVKTHGGCLLDVPSGEVVAGGLCMPHSPRLYEGRLWLLESGTGRLLLVDASTGARQTVVELPGYARGLALCNGYAFVGLSKIRATSDMDGVPLAQQRAALKCGLAVIDLRRGRVMAGLEFQTAVEEIFDVQLLPGVPFPELLGFQKDTVQHTFVIPTPLSSPPNS